MQRLLLYIMTLLLLFAGNAVAEDDLDVTMRMVSDDDKSASDKVVREIRLPDSASDRARDAAAPGLERANEASEKGRRAADSARERARRGLEQRNQRNEIPIPGGDAGRPGNGAPGAGGEGPERDLPDRP